MSADRRAPECDGDVLIEYQIDGSGFTQGEQDAAFLSEQNGQLMRVAMWSPSGDTIFMKKPRHVVGPVSGNALGMVPERPPGNCQSALEERHRITPTRQPRQESGPPHLPFRTRHVRRA